MINFEVVSGTLIDKSVPDALFNYFILKHRPNQNHRLEYWVPNDSLDTKIRKID
jgi:hypothetical protein